jgi:hypothetical protein
LFGRRKGTDSGFEAGEKRVGRKRGRFCPAESAAVCLLGGWRSSGAISFGASWEKEDKLSLAACTFG